MLTFLLKLLNRRALREADGGDDLETSEGRIKAVLRSELNRVTLDGRQLTHRRLETLTLAAGVSKKETIRLLRAIGARPSKRHGSKIWTLQPKD